MKRILLIPARKQGCKAILLGPQRIDATEGLAVPDEATLVRGEQGGMPVTDGVFPRVKRVSPGLLDR